MNLRFLVVLATLFASASAMASSCESNRYESFRQEGDVSFYHYGSTSSTQDQARSLLESVASHVDMVVVTATEQTNGRGTSGRIWMGAPGNTFVTIGVRIKLWTTTNLMMTLLPLKMGTIMASRIESQLESCRSPSRVTIKWPNDVLVNDDKIAGVLIESASDWFLIGIGVNVAFRPTVPTEGPNQGRTATSISQYCTDGHEGYTTTAHTLGEDMAKDLYDWLLARQGSKPKIATKGLLQEWKKWVHWERPLVLRSQPSSSFLPVDIETDGRLRIKDMATGKEQHVVTDYFL